MKWYVRSSEDGHIWGPMSKIDAKVMLDEPRVDGLSMFDASIFDFQSTVQIAEFVYSLRAIRANISVVRSRQTISLQHDVANLCESAATLIERLSSPKVVRGVINGGVLELEEVSEGVEIAIRDYDVDVGEEEEEDEHMGEDERGSFALIIG